MTVKVKVIIIFGVFLKTEGGIIKRRHSNLLLYYIGGVFIAEVFHCSVSRRRI